MGCEVTKPRESSVVKPQGCAQRHETTPPRHQQQKPQPQSFLHPAQTKQPSGFPHQPRPAESRPNPASALRYSGCKVFSDQENDSHPATPTLNGSTTSEASPAALSDWPRAPKQTRAANKPHLPTQSASSPIRRPNARREDGSISISVSATSASSFPHAAACRSGRTTGRSSARRFTSTRSPRPRHGCFSVVLSPLSSNFTSPRAGVTPSGTQTTAPHRVSATPSRRHSLSFHMPTESSKMRRSLSAPSSASSRETSVSATRGRNSRSVGNKTRVPFSRTNSLGSNRRFSRTSSAASDAAPQAAATRHTTRKAPVPKFKNGKTPADTNTTATSTLFATHTSNEMSSNHNNRSGSMNNDSISDAAVSEAMPKVVRPIPSNDGKSDAQHVAVIEGQQSVSLSTSTGLEASSAHTDDSDSLPVLEQSFSESAALDMDLEKEPEPRHPSEVPVPAIQGFAEAIKMRLAQRRNSK